MKLIELLSHVLWPWWGKSSAKGMSILETMIAAVIVAVAALGLGTAIHYLSVSRQKVQIISQAVGVEASLTAALQDPGTYMGYTALLEAIEGGQPPDPSFIPQVNVVLDPTDSSKQFSIKADGQTPTYITIDNKQLGAAPSASNWTVKVLLSKLHYDAGTQSYSYAYNIQANPNLVVMSDLGAGSSSVLAPGPKDLSVSIPTQAVIVAHKGYKQCQSTDIGILGIDAGGNMLCVQHAKKKCALGSISKGLYLATDGSTSPPSFSYELICTGLRTLTCPAQLTDGGVPDLTLYNPYSLQSFVPNVLDKSGPAAGAGTCVFIAAHSVVVKPPPAMSNGMTVTGACPPHYVVTGVSCSAGANDAMPAGSTVVCASSDPATSQPPGGAQASYPDPRSVTCQRLEYKVCCGDDPMKCAPIWTGSVQLSYSCTLNGTTSETINAIAN